jgi:hypothetical protein
MQAKDWHEIEIQDDDENDVTESETPEDKNPEDVADHFGINLSLLILGVALLIAAVWLFSSPSFEKCSALDNVTQRMACYGELRNNLMKPPAKGGEMPAG